VPYYVLWIALLYFPFIEYNFSLQILYQRVYNKINFLLPYVIDVYLCQPISILAHQIVVLNYKIILEQLNFKK
jgi:hypothetical protein